MNSLEERKKPLVSVILPSIRSDRLAAFYESLRLSTRKPFELIIVGPNSLPRELEEYRNIKFVRDFGSPTRAQCIALLLCEGDIVTWQSDDAIMLPSSIDTHVDLLLSMGDDIKNVVVGKYYEGQAGSADRERLQPDSYYTVSGSPASSPLIPSNLWLFNVAFMHRQFIQNLGGFDSSFEGTWASQTDLAIRAQVAGANVMMSGLPCMICDHMPGASGDHRPIYECQTFHDEPLLHSLYRDPKTIQNRQIFVDAMGWKSASAVWERRF